MSQTAGAGAGAAGTGAKANVVKAYAATSATAPLGPWQFERRDVGPLDVQIEILYCGVWHSDLHTVRNECVEARLLPGRCQCTKLWGA